MDGSRQEGRKRVVRLSEGADADLTSIHDRTVQEWGGLQATQYLDLITNAADRLASGDLHGSKIEERDGLLSYTVFWRRAKKGHRIIYAIEAEGILIVRILHTSMDTGRHLP